MANMNLEFQTEVLWIGFTSNSVMTGQMGYHTKLWLQWKLSLIQETQCPLWSSELQLAK